MLNFYTFLLSKKISHRMNDQRTSYDANNKRSLVQWIHIQTTITFLVRKNWTPTPGAIGSYGRLAGKETKDFKIFKILYRLNLLDFYFVDISATLLIVLEMHFSQLFSNIGRALWCIKLSCYFFSVNSYYQVLAYLMICKLYFVTYCT